MPGRMKKLGYHLDAQKGLLSVEIYSPLTSETFEKISNVVDPYIELNGKLNGLVLHLQEFPGWEDFDGFVSHLQFVKNHHKKITKVAFSAGGAVAHLLAPLSSHFVHAEVKQFDFDKFEEALSWASE
ncbi:MAG: STAS/SEC14 domain-containing protein [Bdellovibrionaceae bacterium]|jgi:hypothetical protein|nr:STAS/SEC14 domain-containing protein [Pseudobdellovibrionaceae bacterium]